MGQIIKIEDYLNNNGSETSGRENNGCKNDGSNNNTDHLSEEDRKILESYYSNRYYKFFWIIMFLLNLITVTAMKIFNERTPGFYTLFIITLIVIGIYTAYICWKLR